jgi:hypothetical protein
MSWRDWSTLTPPKNVTLLVLEAHNKHLVDYRLLIASGLTDREKVLMRTIPRAPKTPDYSQKTINEFILTKYQMGRPLEAMV